MEFQYISPKRCPRCGKVFFNNKDPDEIFCPYCDSLELSQAGAEKRRQKIRDGWDEQTRRNRAHGNGLFYWEDPPVEMPRYCKPYRLHLEPNAAITYNGQDIYFEYMQYLMDHKDINDR